MLTGDDPCAQVRLELGACVVGAIDPAERAAVNRHLRTCPTCRAELADIAGLPPLLHRVPADTVGQLLRDDMPHAIPTPPLSTLLRRVASIRRRRRIRTIAAAAITAAAAASGVLALHPAGHQAGPPAVTAWAETVHGTSPVTGAWATVRYTGQPWGTELQASITGVAPGTRCRLLVIGIGGQEIAAGGWDVAGSTKLAWYPASVPLRSASLRSFEIITARKILVTISAR